MKIYKSKSGEKEAEVVFDYFESAKADCISPIQGYDRLKDFKDIFATKEDLANTKSEMIRWMFLFWISQMAAMFAFLKYFR